MHSKILMLIWIPAMRDLQQNLSFYCHFYGKLWQNSPSLNWPLLSTTVI